VRQRVLFASLPNGDVISNESLTAQEDCTVERVQQGFIRIINESWPTYKGNCNGVRRLHHPEGYRDFMGYPTADPSDDVTLDLDHPGWLNVDDRLGIVFSGTGMTRYLNRHFYPPFSFRAVSDDLFLSLDETPTSRRTGDLIGELSVLVCPEQAAADTPARRLIKPEASGQAACLITDGYLCAANFGPKRTVCAFSTSYRGPAPVFPGITAVHGRNAEHRLLLESEEATFLEAILTVWTDGRIRADVTPEGTVFLTNEGDGKAVVRAAREGRAHDVSLRPAETISVR
jgi:hypothetical protein